MENNSNYSLKDLKEVHEKMFPLSTIRLPTHVNFANTLSLLESLKRIKYILYLNNSASRETKSLSGITE
jgi:hypothetical protein